MRDRHAGEQGRERQAVLVQKNQQNKGFLLVPAERIELPTNGLQNRCSTAELRRHLVILSTACK